MRSVLPVAVAVLALVLVNEPAEAISTKGFARVTPPGGPSMEETEEGMASQSLAQPPYSGEARVTVGQAPSVSLFNQAANTSGGTGSATATGVFNAPFLVRPLNPNATRLSIRLEFDFEATITQTGNGESSYRWSFVEFPDATIPTIDSGFGRGSGSCGVIFESSSAGCGFAPKIDDLVIENGVFTGKAFQTTGGTLGEAGVEEIRYYGVRVTGNSFLRAGTGPSVGTVDSRNTLDSFRVFSMSPDFEIIPIPEPATASLLTLGLALLCIGRRRGEP